MERAESDKSNLKLLDAHVVPEISERLAENVEDMQQKSNQIMKLIEDDGNSSIQEADDCDRKKPQLLTLVQEFSTMYQSLAEQYNQIAGEPQLENSPQHPDFEEGSPHVTPDRVLQFHDQRHHHVGTDLSLSSGDGSFGTSPKEGTESSSLSSDFESEYFTSAINGYLDTARQINDMEPYKKSKPVIQPISMNLTCEEVDVDGSEELVAKATPYEEEIKALNHKLQRSEEEVAALKSALNRSEGAAHDMQVEITKKDANLEEAKTKALQLEGRILELETHIADSLSETETLTKELKHAQQKIEILEEEADVLNIRLDSERQNVVELQRCILTYQKSVADQESEIVRQQTALCDALRKHSMEQEQLKMELESQRRQWEEKLRQLEDEKTKLEDLHHDIVLELQGHIIKTMAAVTEKETQIVSLNKEHDKLKLQHDMVVAEKDNLNARTQALSAELSCRDHHVKELTIWAAKAQEDAGELNSRVHQVEREVEMQKVQISELTIGAAKAQEAAGELRSRVHDLEREVEMQKVLISDGAEKKREAIRQLCFSLEHYRTGYNELREAFRGHKRYAAILAS